MVVMSYLIPMPILLAYPFNLFGGILIVIGFMMALKVVLMFKQAKTEIHPFKPPQQLVTHGLFSFSRNPIYLAMLITLIGLWLLLASLSAGLGLMVFFWIMNTYNIPFEEKQLEKIFGQDYLDYKKRTRRWI